MNPNRKKQYDLCSYTSTVSEYSLNNNDNKEGHKGNVAIERKHRLDVFKLLIARMNGDHITTDC